jgi:hypothetical protein
MNSVIETLVNTFKGLWYGKQEETQKKDEVEGYLMMNDNTTNKSLLLVKDGEKSWKTKWFNNNENTYKTPLAALSELFSKATPSVL